MKRTQKSKSVDPKSNDSKISEDTDRDHELNKSQGADSRPTGNYNSTENPEDSRFCGEIGGPEGPEPTRYGDWEVKGRCSDF